jgi:hypothetical protein
MEPRAADSTRSVSLRQDEPGSNRADKGVITAGKGSDQHPHSRPRLRIPTSIDRLLRLLFEDVFLLPSQENGKFIINMC